jgi:GNAT superfamily N-acetyltransferase
MIAGLPVAIRAASPDEVPMIYDSWIESFRMSHAAGPIPMDMYRTLYREIIRRILTSDGVVALVAANPEIERDNALGYIICHPASPPIVHVPIVHYVYVKAPFRRLGLARMLMLRAGVDPREEFVYTFKSRAASSLGWDAGRFDPILVRRMVSTRSDQ